MLAGIIGDVLGSVYEGYQWQFKNFKLVQPKTETRINKVLKKQIPFVRSTPTWTDDTLCSLALYSAYAKGLDPKEQLLALCNQYNIPEMGYGSAFKEWFKAEHPQPYGSSGNGALMRIGFVPYLKELNFIQKVQYALALTNLTHNSPAAQKATVDYIRLCEKIKKDKSFNCLREYVLENEYPFTVEQMHEKALFVRDAQDTLLQAAAIVVESKNLEEVYTNSFYVGGDSDTLACIAGILGSQLYEVPLFLKDFALSTLMKDTNLFKIYEDFELKYLI